MEPTSSYLRFSSTVIALDCIALVKVDNLFEKISDLISNHEQDSDCWLSVEDTTTMVATNYCCYNAEGFAFGMVALCLDTISGSLWVKLTLAEQTLASTGAVRASIGNIA